MLLITQKIIPFLANIDLHHLMTVPQSVNG